MLILLSLWQLILGKYILFDFFSGVAIRNSGTPIVHGYSGSYNLVKSEPRPIVTKN